MKKMFVLALLSSAMIFADKSAAVKVLVPVKATVQEVRSVVAKVAPAQSCTVTTAVNYIKAHKFVAGSAVLVAGVATLYYTNASFRAMVRGWLGLDTEIKK